MPVNTDMKLAFVHIPKTGGVSITNSMAMIDLGHHRASYYKENYPEFVRFAVIRALNDRTKSVFRYIRDPQHGNPDFEALKIQIQPMDYWLDEFCHFYLRFENLQQDLNMMLKILGLNRVKLLHLNQSQWT